MREDLSPWDRVHAELLLGAVRAHKQLRSAAAALGVPYRTAQLYWREWRLEEDYQLRGGGRRPRRSRQPANSA